MDKGTLLDQHHALVDKYFEEAIDAYNNRDREAYIRAERNMQRAQIAAMRVAQSMTDDELIAYGWREQK